MLRSIRPTRATTSLAASVDPTEARNAVAILLLRLEGSDAVHLLLHPDVLGQAKRTLQQVGHSSEATPLPARAFSLDLV
jgi:hypothetical protein